MRCASTLWESIPLVFASIVQGVSTPFLMLNPEQCAQRNREHRSPRISLSAHSASKTTLSLLREPSRHTGLLAPPAVSLRHVSLKLAPAHQRMRASLCARLFRGNLGRSGKTVGSSRGIFAMLVANMGPAIRIHPIRPCRMDTLAHLQRVLLR